MTTTDQPAALRVERLSRKFGDFLAVDDISFEIPQGVICGFIGPNGAGKTTTMRICATLDLPSYGNAWVSGYSVLSHPREVRAKLGFMPDLFPVEPQIQVRHMIDFFGRAHGLRGQALQRATDAIIEFTSLETLLQKNFGSLSKGMRQRAALATTLMHDPDLLILDEPAAGLDPRARIELRQLLMLLAKRGKTILISSHILAELSEVCDRVVIIEQGRIKAAGSVKDVQQSASNQAADHQLLVVQALSDAELVAHFLESEGATEIEVIERSAVRFQISSDVNHQAQLLEKMVNQGLKPVRMREHTVDLEELFMSLTEGKVQ